MFTKDHEEKFSDKIEPVVESGKAKTMGMSRLSFPRGNVSKKKKRKKETRKERRNQKNKEKEEKGRKGLKE